MNLPVEQTFNYSPNFRHTSTQTESGEVHNIIVNVLESRFEEAMKVITKIDKQVKKLGAGQMAYSVGTPFDEKVRVNPAANPKNNEPEGTITRVPITIACIVPKINGWTFVAAVEFVAQADGKVAPLLCKVPGITTDLPERFRSTTTSCDHCHKDRARNKVYILQKDASYIQVGHTCLTDFSGAGYSPEKIVKFIWEAMADIESMGGWGRGIPPAFTALDLTTVAYSIARRSGQFVSNSMARKYHDLSGKTIATTADKVIHYLLPPDFSGINDAILVRKLKAEYNEWRASVTPNDADKTEAAIALKTYLQAPDNNDSDYDYNVKTVLRMPLIPVMKTSISVSFLSRHFAKLRRTLSNQARNDEGIEYYPGIVGEKITVEAKQVFHREFPGQYGIKTLVKFVDTDGHLFVWWASKGIDTRDGNVVSITAAIKGFDSYEGKKQLVLTRCKTKVVKATETHRCELCNKYTDDCVEMPGGNWFCKECASKINVPAGA